MIDGDLLRRDAQRHEFVADAVSVLLEQRGMDVHGLSRLCRGDSRRPQAFEFLFGNHFARADLPDHARPDVGSVRAGADFLYDLGGEIFHGTA